MVKVKPVDLTTSRILKLANMNNYSVCTEQNSKGNTAIEDDASLSDFMKDAGYKYKSNDNGIFVYEQLSSGREVKVPFESIGGDMYLDFDKKTVTKGK